VCAGELSGRQRPGSRQNEGLPLPNDEAVTALFQTCCLMCCRSLSAKFCAVDLCQRNFVLSIFVSENIDSTSSNAWMCLQNRY
jgi:hypothetical protein